MLRMARYAARLGFEPDPETDALVDPELLRTVTGSRLGAELRLLLREPQPAALLALERHGLGRALLGDEFAVDPQLVTRSRGLTPPDARADLVALAATMNAATAEESSAGARVRARLDDLSFPAHERDVLVRAATATPLPAADDVALWRRLRREPAEAVAVAGARGDESAARRWLAELRHRRLAITGDDIVATGLSGPAVGEALDAATEAMLRGDAPDRESQLAAALRGRA